jgi:hypothetical protein
LITVSGRIITSVFSSQQLIKLQTYQLMFQYRHKPFFQN